MQQTGIKGVTTSQTIVAAGRVMLEAVEEIYTKGTLTATDQEAQLVLVKNVTV